MCKKTFLFLIVSFFLNTEIIYTQWNVEKSPSKNCLHSVSLINSNSGWIVGDKGTILYKSNSFWIEAPKVTEQNLYSVCILNKNDGWAVGSRGIILHFDGKNWKQVSSPTNHDLLSVSFNDPDNGIAVGICSTILNYKNGTWTQMRNTSNSNLFAVTYRNDLSFIGGERECVRVPIITIGKNDEETITTSYTKSLFSVKSICLAGENDMWAVGNMPGPIVHYNGKEWIEVNVNEKLPSLNSIFFYNEKSGICVGYNGTILTYSEKGWVMDKSPVKKHLRGAAVSGNTYYAVGDSGTILTWKNSIGMNISDSDLNRMQKKVEAFPNPCDEILNILIPEEEDFITDLITVTNIHGQVVFKEKIAPGSGGYSYPLKTSGFDNGLYFIKAVSADSKTASGKFIIKH